MLVALFLGILTNEVVSQDESLLCRRTENSTFSDGGKAIDILLKDFHHFNFSVMYEGECRTPDEDGVCALGERLFVRGASVQCDCDEVEDTQDTSRIFDN